MVHVNNIPHILSNGITHKKSISANLNYVSIGDTSLISSRDTKKGFVTNGITGYGFVETINIGDFIPFYFGLRTPMLYVIQKGGNFVPQKNLPEEIIYCVTSVQKIVDNNLTFYFTDGHATNNLTTFYDRTKISFVEDLVDLKAANFKYWKDDLDLDLKRRKESELLVLEDIPVSCILGYICYNETSRLHLLDLGLKENKVIIKPNYYF